MYLKIENCRDSNIRIIDYPGTMRFFAAVHCMGIFDPVTLVKNKSIGLVDRFTGEIHTIISKPSKKEICNYLMGGK